MSDAFVSLLVLAVLTRAMRDVSAEACSCPACTTERAIAAAQAASATTPTPAPTYSVIVSNLGTVYNGEDRECAVRIYDEYKADSINIIGRAAGEDVAITYMGEPYREYIGVLSQEGDN